MLHAALHIKENCYLMLAVLGRQHLCVNFLLNEPARERASAALKKPHNSNHTARTSQTG